MADESMMVVEVEVSGCDDTTRFNMNVTPAELDFLRRLAAQSVESSEYGCQPIIVVGAPF